MKALALTLALSLISHRAFAGEKELVKAYPKLFQRAGAKLTLQLAEKKAKVFTNDARFGSSYSEHSLVNYYPKRRLAVVQHFYNEGGDYTLLSLATGKELKLAEKPVWNKERSLFVAVNEGEFEGDKRGLQLGHCDAKECRLLLEKDGRYTRPKWLGNHAIQAVNRIPAADGGPGLVVRVKCTIPRKSLKARCEP